jgi:hypothetical protein
MIKKSFWIGIVWGIMACGPLWTATANISNSAADSEDACVAINSSGQIGVIWVEKYANGTQYVHFSTGRGSSWSTPEMLPGQSGSSAFPRIARGIGGGFVAVWHDQRQNCMRFSQYNGSWSEPVTVSQVGGYDMGSPSIATSTNGRIAVAWTVGSPTFPDAFVNIWNNGWSGPVNISNTAYGSKYCDITAGPDGEFYAVWQDNDYIPSTNMDYFYTMMSNDRGYGNWTSPQVIDRLGAWTFRPYVAVNSSGDILSSFYYMQGSSYWGAYYCDGEWLEPLMMSDVGDHHDHNLYFTAVCPYGSDGFLFIYRDVMRNIIYRVVGDGGLGNAVNLSTSNQCYHPYIAYSSSVGAVAVWTDWSQSSDVLVSIFDPDDSGPVTPPVTSVQPPLGVQADYRNIPFTALNMQTDLIVNRNLFTVQYFRKLTWEYNGEWDAWGIALSKYRVYRRLKTSETWEYQDEVPASQLSYIDRNGVTQEDRFYYQARGVDTLGNEYYAYNWIRWGPNPLNITGKIAIQSYRVYRRLTGQGNDGYVLWKTVDAATNSVEDHATEIRQNTLYDYAVSAVSATGKESPKTEAVKIYTNAESKSRKG